VDSINRNSTYPLVIAFTGYLNTRSYTLQGHEFKEELQTLFWKEIKFEAPEQPPRMRLINGIEVPDVSFYPEVSEHYFYPSLRPILCSSTFCLEDNETDKFRAVNGLCYPYTPEGKEAAILHSKALLGIK
jgi:hypothetical protein